MNTGSGGIRYVGNTEITRITLNIAVEGTAIPLRVSEAAGLNLDAETIFPYRVPV